MPAIARSEMKMRATRTGAKHVVNQRHGVKPFDEVCDACGESVLARCCGAEEEDGVCAKS